MELEGGEEEASRGVKGLVHREQSMCRYKRKNELAAWVGVEQDRDLSCCHGCLMSLQIEQ